MIKGFLQKVTGIRDDEFAAAALSCLYFFFLLAGYYVLRPLREEMGLAGGVRNLPWLYLANLVVMLLLTPLFGLLANRTPRRRLVPSAYLFFLANMAVFYVLMRGLPERHDVWVGRVFYVWLSVFNMWAVSLFWATMADRWDLERSKRLFGFIAVGGTVGAIVGAAITASLVDTLGRTNLLFGSMLMLGAAIVTVTALGRLVPARVDRADVSDAPVGGSMVSGITATAASPYLLGISAYLFLYSLTSTFLYFEQASIVADAVADRAARTALFARIDLWVNILTLVLQLGVTGRLIPRIGVGATLTILPVLTVVGFLALGFAPVLAVLVIFQVVRRGGNYALARPARETLFTIVPPEQTYKAKSFIDTFVYRGGDMLGATLFDALGRLGMGLAGVAFTAVPVAALWGGVGLALGAAQRRRAAADHPPEES